MWLSQHSQNICSKKCLYIYLLYLQLPNNKVKFPAAEDSLLLLLEELNRFLSHLNNASLTQKKISVLYCCVSSVDLKIATRISRIFIWQLQQRTTVNTNVSSVVIVLYDNMSILCIYIRWP